MAEVGEGGVCSIDSFMRTALRLGIAGVASVLWGCAGSLPHPPYAPQPSSALFPVPIAPPPPRVEQVPDSPRNGAVWIDGEWVYRRGRWAWSLGRWVATPEGGFFSPWVVVRAPDGALYFAPGAWRDKGGKAIDPPPPLAVASVSAGPVVDSEGSIELTGRTLKPGSAAATAAESAPPAAATPPAAPAEKPADGSKPPP